jgi:apocytochrome f
MVKKTKKWFNFFLQQFICSLFMHSFFGLLLTFFFSPEQVFGFPIYAQQAYENPRESNGKIVCANCHLAKKSVEFELPSSILPNSVFETIIRIPIDGTKKQILGNGKRGDLNVGAILVMPEGFKLAPKSRIDGTLKEKIKGLQIIPYSPKKENILVIGPIPSGIDKYQKLSTNKKEIIFPILAPDPKTNATTHFLKYPMYVGANQGRAQINPNGEKTNNNGIYAETSGKIVKIAQSNSNFLISILTKDGQIKTQKIPETLSFVGKENQLVMQDELLTNDPNVGGFGQTEAATVLQSPARIYGYLVLCIFVALAQSMLVLKKKQFEKVQLAELDL